MRFLACLLLGLVAGSAHANAKADVMQVLQMLDYVGVDYGECVIDGEVVNPPEFEEQQNFAELVIARLDGLPATDAQPALLVQARSLQQAIDDKAPAERIQQLTAGLSAQVVAAYPVTPAPRKAPDVAAAAALFQAQCTACHGASGHGDGAAGAAMDPPPTDFHDPARQRQRSAFGLYNVISNGVAGTGMAGYSQLPDDTRWALAYHVGQLIYTDADRERGRALVEGGEMFGLDSLEALSQTTPQQMADAHGADGVALMAYLRAQPAALTQAARGGALTLARERVAESLAVYADGDPEAAARLALSAYLDGYEQQEAAIAAVAPAMNAQVETAMLTLRQMIRSQAPVAEVEAHGEAILAMLNEAEAKLGGDRIGYAPSLIGSFLILSREGLEAILVLAALFAFLAKVERPEARRYVHFGWIGALAAGGLTWLIASQVIAISGASREITEGLSALIAAAVLLSVGLWMHNRSLSGQWQRFIAEQMNRAISRGGLWGIAGLAFIATYREVFETVLFYQALWAQGEHGAILVGAGLAALVLVVIAWAVLSASRRLPLQQFFSVSAVFIVLLALVFTGQGVRALQEAGWIDTHAFDFVSLPLLGIYPNWQGLIAQAALAVLIVAAMAWNRRAARRAMAG